MKPLGTVCWKSFQKNYINTDDGLQRFGNVNLEVLNQHAPQNKKYVPGNQMPFETKQLSKEIMKSSTLRNNFLRNRTEDNHIFYNRQRNYCISFSRKFMKEHYKNLNVKEITDIKMFWKTVESLLLDKSFMRDIISISEKDEISKTETEAAETLNYFFSNMIKNLNI